MLLKKYKQEQLFNSNPKIFLIFELLSVNNEKFTAMKKNLNEKGFKVKYLRTKETLGILRNFKHLKKEHFVQSKNLFKSTLICIYLKTNFDNVMENGVTNQIEHLVNGLAFGEDFYEKYRLVLVGMYFEGLFYNPKALLHFQTKPSLILSSLISPTVSMSSFLVCPLVSIINTLIFIAKPLNS